MQSLAVILGVCFLATAGAAISIWLLRRISYQLFEWDGLLIPDPSLVQVPKTKSSAYSGDYVIIQGSASGSMVTRPGAKDVTK